MLALLFGYIEHLKTIDLDAGLYEYLKKNGKISFMMSDTDSSVSSIASKWNHGVLNKIFIHDYDYTSLDKKEVQERLALMTQARA